MTMHEHRIELKELTANCIRRFANSDVELYGNKALQDYYSDEDETILFRTFDEWVNMGYKVNKGEKACKFWGVPQNFEIRDKKNPAKIESIGTFCPIIFKFSELQVTKIENLR
jgi:hypothetical protein